MKVTRLLHGATSATAIFTFAACSSFTEATSDNADDSGAGDTSLTDATPDVSLEAAGDADNERPILPPAPDGCSDGTREGYVGSPRIAACDGYWAVPGIDPTTPPTCGLRGGNNGPTVAGVGCSAADLCAPGWHVCTDHADVMASLDGSDGVGPCGTVTNSTGKLFYATAQGSAGGGTCAPASAQGNADDIYGCGDLASKADPTSCSPLDARLSNDEVPAGWSVAGSTTERTTVTHTSEPGGVLCCKQ